LKGLSEAGSTGAEAAERVGQAEADQQAGDARG